MSDDQKPCPFCGGELGITTSFDHEQGDKWGYASCGECAARGPEVRTQYAREHDAPWHSEAIAAWNTRADADRIEQLERERVLDDGRPCVTDVFLAAAIEQLDDKWDFFEAVKCWCEGDWEGALEGIKLEWKE